MPYQRIYSLHLTLSCTVFILFPNVYDKVKYALPENFKTRSQYEMPLFKGIVSPDWKGLHMFSLDRFEV
jgi:hypothetical protein